VEEWLPLIHVRERGLFYPPRSLETLSPDEQTLLKVPNAIYQGILRSVKSLYWRENDLYFLKEPPKIFFDENRVESYLAVTGKQLKTVLSPLGYSPLVASDLEVTWLKKEDRGLLGFGGLLFVTVILFLLGYCFLLLKKNIAFRRERSLLAARHQFGLELLSHELRTPLTSMRLALASMEQEYSQLSTSGQQAFLDLQNNELRMLQTLEKAQNTLLSELKTEGLEEDKISFKQLIADVVEGFSDEIQVDFKGEIDDFMEYSPFWLSTCLNHLLKNATQHGKPPFLKTNTAAILESDLQWSDVVVLDRILGTQDSIQWLSAFRQRGGLNPVIILSARALVADKILGLEFGADDYLTKPFEPRELVARIRRLVQRTQVNRDNSSLGSEVLERGTFKLALGDFICDFNLQKILLTQMEWRLLKYFMENEGKPLAREKILQVVWGVRFHSTRTLDLHVAQLRQKFKKECIETLHGRGYRFQS
jgi:DNA-binding response OmpR family regulator